MKNRVGRTGKYVVGWLALGLFFVLAIVAGYFFFFQGPQVNPLVASGAVLEEPIPTPVGVIDIDYSAIFLDPKSKGYSFAKAGMEQYVKIMRNSKNEIVIDAHDKSCSIPFKDSLAQVVRITRLANDTYNISCLFGPMYSKINYSVRKENSNEHYDEFLGWFRECTPEAAKLLDVGFPSNKTIDVCTGRKSRVITTHTDRDPADVRDYYYLVFACNAFAPSDKLYAELTDPMVYPCFLLWDGFGQKTRYSSIGAIIDAETKEVYFPITVTSKNSST